jgi:very-short-patch-repair endonuclease
VIEADGGQHADSDDDQRRTAWLESRRWRGIRFWNNEILTNPEGVQDAILRAPEAAGPTV